MAKAIDPRKLAELATASMNPDSLDNFDWEMVEQLLPLIRTSLNSYFRAEVRGLENIPAGKAMVVGNHNAGITFLEPFIMGAEWYATRGGEDPFYFLAHDAMVRIPLVKNMLMKFGCVTASRENSDRILDGGRKLVVFPGGNYEAFRPFHERWKVDFGGHNGFAKLALDKDAPIVPMLSVGGHETFMVLHRGRKLAQITGVEKLLRSKACPVTLGLPWGISIGPIFHLPLPAKSVVELGEPIVPSEVVRGIKGREAQVAAVYEAVTGRIQQMMDGVRATRRFPVLG